jgi:plasmid stability protein
MEPAMPDLLVRDIEDDLKRLIEHSARAHRRSLSDEVKSLVRQALAIPDKPVGMGTYLYSLMRDEDRGDDLVFEYRGDLPKPPDFE